MPPDDDRRNRSSWRSGRRAARPRVTEHAAEVATPATATADRRSWRGTRIESISGSVIWRWTARLLLALVALLLVAELVRLLLSVRRPVPIVTAITGDYRAPFGPLPMAGEDRALLLSMSLPGTSFLSPLSALVSDIAPDLTGRLAGDDLLPIITRSLQDIRPGGPRRDAVVLYITAVGMIDSEGRACLVPPSTADDPISIKDDSLLQVSRLLSAVRGALPPSTGILVVLDCGRETTPWPLGIDAPAFPAAVEAAVEAAQLDRLWVLLPASAGQRPLASPAQGGSGFALHFTRGFRGMADTTPWGDGDGTVTLGELSAYLRTRVDEWAMAVFGMRQTPVLLPRGGAAALPLAWAGRVPARLEAPVGGHVDTWWLAERWQAAEQVRDAAVSEQPLRWAAYESLLLRAEQMRRAGSDAVDRQGTITVDAVTEQLESSLRMSPTAAAAMAPDIRLARARLVKLDAAGQKRRDDIFTVLDATVADPTPAKRPAAPRQSYGAARWIDRAVDGWAWLLTRLEAGRPVDHPLLERWIEWLGTEPLDDVVPTQVHVLRMLTRWSDPADWSRDPQAFAHIIGSLAASREVSLAWNVRLDRFPAHLDRQLEADDLLRRGIDLAFVGGPAACAEAGALARQARERFEDLMVGLRLRDEAVLTFDTVRAELPYLAAWWVDDRQRGSHNDQASARVDWESLLVAYEEFQALFLQALVRPAADTVDQPEFLELIEAKRRRLDGLFAALKAGYLDHCEFLADRAADSPSTLGALCRALATPLARGDLRMRMLRRMEELEFRFATAFAATPDQGAEPLPPPDPLAALTGWVTVQQEHTHPAVSALLLEPPHADFTADTPAETATLAGMQAAAVRNAARTLPDAIADLNRRCAEIEAAGRDERQVLTMLGEGSGVVRRLATVVCDRPQFITGAEPAKRYLATAWHGRLLQQATVALDDFWAGSRAGATPFCVRRARMLIDAASEIVRVSHVLNGDVARQRLTSRVNEVEAASEAFAAIEIAPERIMLAPAAGGQPPPGDVRLVARPGVPAGVASFWLALGVDERPIAALATPGSTTTVSRLPANVGASPTTTSWSINRTTSERLQETRTSILDMVAWFRGHRLVRGLPVVPAAASRTTGWIARPPEPTRVTVRGDLPRRQAVALVFDCSGSMGRRLPDGRSRLEAGREAVAELLGPLATAGNWDVSLWLYGHRTRWTRDRSGRYTAGLTPAGEQAKVRATAAGDTFTLVPGDDVERVLPMQPLTQGVVREIESILAPIDPGGETPLYRAISEAIGTDFDGAQAGLPGHVLVVTDGANDQSGGQIVTAAGVEDLLARKNSRRPVPIRVDIIGFALEADSMERALRMGQARDVADGSGGRFYRADDAEALAGSLRESLRVLRWQVRGPGLSGDPVELGGSTTLPLSTPGQRRGYDVMLDAGPGSPQRRIAAENDMALDLRVGGGGRTLEFLRYDGGTEQGLRDSRADLFDPQDPRRRCFVGAHLASRAGDTVRFPLSVQNDDATAYSPRPAAIWVRVQPQRGDTAVGGPFVFYDLSLQAGRPVPVFDLVAPNWPHDADGAGIQAWFRFDDVPPDVAFPVGDLVPGIPKPLAMAGFPDLEVTVVLEPATSPDEAVISVVEQHPAARAGELPMVRISVPQGCREAVHVVEPGTGRVRHTFTVEAQGGRISPATQLTITDARRIVAGAITTGPLPLTVPVPSP
jgi:hypothetical protein